MPGRGEHRPFGIEGEGSERGGREGVGVSGSSSESSQSSGRGSKSKTPALDSFGRDLTELAKQNKLDPVIGREREIERAIQILCRRPIGQRKNRDRDG